MATLFGALVCCTVGLLEMTPLALYLGRGDNINAVLTEMTPWVEDDPKLHQITSFGAAALVGAYSVGLMSYQVSTIHQDVPQSNTIALSIGRLLCGVCMVSWAHETAGGLNALYIFGVMDMILSFFGMLGGMFNWSIVSEFSAWFSFMISSLLWVFMFSPIMVLDTVNPVVDLIHFEGFPSSWAEPSTREFYIRFFLTILCCSGAIKFVSGLCFRASSIRTAAKMGIIQSFALSLCVWTQDNHIVDITFLQVLAGAYLCIGLLSIGIVKKQPKIKSA
mmetsp:Transcript_1751/g.2766  ORF Transcript_1751/g.2766 Transcript_1751/m.2766 type:complete len:277 (-) Transcript_1751:20-850(-)